MTYFISLMLALSRLYSYPTFMGIESAGEDDRTIAPDEKMTRNANEFFAGHPDVDWVVADQTTGMIVCCGIDSELVAERDFSELERKAGEPLVLIGRPVGFDTDSF